MIARIEVTSIVFATVDDLKVMSVKMERMLASIIVVEYNLNDLVFVKHKSIGVGAIDLGFGSIRPCRKSCIERRYFW